MNDTVPTGVYIYVQNTQKKFYHFPAYYEFNLTVYQKILHDSNRCG